MSEKQTAKTWDLPTRLYHWILALLIAGALITSQVEESFNPTIPVHRTIGLMIFGVIIFRLLWGFFGNAQARFRNFPLFPLRRVRQDVATLGVGGKPQHWKGHSPIGSWSAVALLLLIGLQATTGLMTQDDIVVVGPLVYYLPNSVVVFATQTHYLLPKFFIPLIAIHIFAVFWHEYARKHKILKAMFVGHRPKPPDAQADAIPQEEAERPMLALGILLLAALVCVGLYLLY